MFKLQFESLGKNIVLFRPPIKNIQKSNSNRELTFSNILRKEQTGKYILKGLLSTSKFFKQLPNFHLN